MIRRFGSLHARNCRLTFQYRNSLAGTGRVTKTPPLAGFSYNDGCGGGIGQELVRRRRSSFLSALDLRPTLLSRCPQILAIPNVAAPRAATPPQPREKAHCRAPFRLCGCGGGNCTRDLQVMHTATVFTAPDVTSGFVVWTIPFPSTVWFGNLPSSLYTFADILSALGSVLPLLSAGEVSPNLTDIPQAITHLRALSSLASYFCSTPLR